MRTLTRLIATLELALIFPAALFMTALVVRHLRPEQYEPAHTAQRIVMWYAGKGWTLWILLLALPLTVLVTGGATLLRGWKGDTHPATLVVATTTLAATGILVVVVFHMLAN